MGDSNDATTTAHSTAEKHFTSAKQTRCTVLRNYRTSKLPSISPPVSKLRTKSVKLGGDTRLATPPAHARALPSTVPDARPDDLGP